MESKGDMNVASSAGDVQHSSRRRTQEVDCEVNKSWAAVYQSIARRMRSYLDNSEASNVGTKELEEHVLAPNEPSVDMEHIVRQARGEKHKKCSRSSADKEQKRSWSPVLRDGRECLDLREEIEQVSEKQELLASLMESKKCLQKDAPERFQEQTFQELKELEEQKSIEAVELLGRKYKLRKLEKGRDRARILQQWEPSGAEGGFAVATDGSSFCSCSPSVTYDVDEAMSTSSRKSPSMVKERYWWSADLEGQMEKLEAEGSFSVAESGSMDPERNGPLVSSDGALKRRR